MKETLDMDISIFYARNMWHKLMNELIYIFIQNTKGIAGYSLKLSTHRGNHIKLKLQTNKAQANVLAEKADSYIRDFLKNNPSLSTASRFPENGIFLDFENNSVHYGAPEEPIMDSLEIDDKNLEQQLSSLLMQVFQVYKEDMVENLTEIMMECFIILCRAAKMKGPEAYALFDHLLKSEYRKYTQESLERIEKANGANYKNNKEAILDFVNSYDNVTFPIKDKAWQNKWYSTVQLYCRSFTKKRELEETPIQYITMIHYLCNAFNFKDKVSVFYLLSRAFKETVT
jgi:hypothetical protein